MPNKQGPPAGERWDIKGLGRFATVTQWTLRDEPEGILQTCTAAKKFPRYFPGRGPGAGELTASENWKVRRAHAGARRSLSAPAALPAGATGTSRAQAPQRRRAPPSTAWPPPSGPALRLLPRPPSHQSEGAPRLPVPEAPPWAGAPPANGRPSPAPSARSPRRAGSEREKRTQPVGAAAPDPPPAAARRPPPPPPPRIGCTVPTRKSSSAARQRRASAMTQEYDK